MQDFWTQTVLWGVALWKIGVAALIIFIGFLSRKITQSLFQGPLKRRAAATEVQWDDELVAMLAPPLAVFVQILLWYVAALFLMLPESPVNIRFYVFQGLKAALGVTAIWAGLRMIDVISNAMERFSARTESRLDDQLIPLVRKTLKFILVTAASIMIIQNLGYSVTSMVASLGVGGLALALAAKDTIANVFGSVIVFTDRPFHIGDWVQFSGIEGTIEEIGFRTTRIRRFDKSQVTVPNSVFSTSPIINHSRRSNQQIYLTLGIAYETDPETVKALLGDIRELVSSHPEIDQTFHFVNFTDFGEYSLKINVYCFTRTPEWVTILTIREDLMLRIMEIVRSRKVDIAYPARSVYLKGDSPERAREFRPLSNP